MATLSITVPDAQVQRVQDAITDRLGLPAPATVDDVRQFLVGELIAAVLSYERTQAEAAARDSITEIGASL